MDSKELLKMAVQAADGRRAEDITALKVDAITPMADYFVIMTGGSKPLPTRLSKPRMKTASILRASKASRRHSGS